MNDIHRAAQLAQIRDEAIAACESRRGRVLAHPDIAARLTEPPLRFSKASHWNGFIPTGGPRRRALIDICQAVADRDGESS